MKVFQTWWESEFFTATSFYKAFTSFFHPRYKNLLSRTSLHVHTTENGISLFFHNSKFFLTTTENFFKTVTPFSSGKRSRSTCKKKVFNKRTMLKKKKKKNSERRCNTLLSSRNTLNFYSERDENFPAR